MTFLTVRYSTPHPHFAAAKSPHSSHASVGQLENPPSPHRPAVAMPLLSSIMTAAAVPSIILFIALNPCFLSVWIESDSTDRLPERFSTHILLRLRGLPNLTPRVCLQCRLGQFRTMNRIIGRSCTAVESLAIKDSGGSDSAGITSSRWSACATTAFHCLRIRRPFFCNRGTRRRI